MMKATINNTEKPTRDFKVGDIVIDNNDGHVVLIIEASEDVFSGLTLRGCIVYNVNEMCIDIDKGTFTLFVGTITLEN